jgi:hypothetical protein
MPRQIQEWQNVTIQMGINNDSNIGTTGGSGFGLMSIISAMSEGYIHKTSKELKD